MKKYSNQYQDRRLEDGCCAICGKSHGETTDHIPARALLDKPYPDNLLTIKVCNECNNKSSKDEEYLAYLIRWLLSLEDSESLIDTMHNNWFKEKRSLEDRMFSSLSVAENGSPEFVLESSRINSVLKKYALGHAYYETSEALCTEPHDEGFALKPDLSEEMLLKFNTMNVEVCPNTMYPELGSRLFIRMLRDGLNDWIVIQEGVYRYHVDCQDSMRVRIVVREFLFYEALWI